VDAEKVINKLMDFYKVYSISELAVKLNTKQPIVSGWKARDSVNAIKKKCRELGIYDEIFGDVNTNNFQNSNNIIAQDFSSNSSASHSQTINTKYDIDENILKLVDTLYSFAKKSNKVDELVQDLSKLIPKYL